MTTSNSPIEPTRVWTAREWDAWNLEEKGESHREFRKRDFFRRAYSPPQPGDTFNVTRSPTGRFKVNNPPMQFVRRHGQ